MGSVCRFKFAKGTERQFIEESVASAIFNAECVFGKPEVRVGGVAYYASENSRVSWLSDLLRKRFKRLFEIVRHF